MYHQPAKSSKNIFVFSFIFGGDILEIIEIILNRLNQKNIISEEEKEMLEIIKELYKKPFDRQSAEKKANETYTKHSDLIFKVGSLPNVVKKDSRELSDKEIYDNLYAQLYFLYQKYNNK